MTYEVEVGGRRRTIDLRRVGQDWEVTLDGRMMPVSVSGFEGRWSLLVGPAATDGTVQSDVGAAFRRPMRSYEISLEGGGSGSHLVHVNGLAVSVSLLDPRARRTRGPAAEANAGTGPRTIAAPMPGRIVKLLVEVGHAVAAHQGLVVVEAMKMENELRAPRAGTVTAVRVTEGMSVDAGAVLIEIE